MNQRELLFQFEEKYPFLYEIQANGVPIYTCFRDDVLCILEKGNRETNSFSTGGKGKIFLLRLLKSMVGIFKHRKAKTLIFTSSVYRRDHGRNLAVEWLLDRYEDAVVFEWPTRQDDYDIQILHDKLRDYYCPIDCYLIIYKLRLKLRKKEHNQLVAECKEKMKKELLLVSASHCENERIAMDFLIQTIPVSFATTTISQKIFEEYFSRYKRVERVIDFWGSARENIVPVIKGKPKCTELQHGIITSYHPGYVYPKCARERAGGYFDREVLVYGDKTKKTLVESSVFKSENVHVIGNPRIEKYKQVFPSASADRKLILFASGAIGKDYYTTMIAYLTHIQNYMDSDEFWKGYQIAIKLHPRENNENLEKYRKALPKAVFYGNSSQLYDLFGETYVLLTLASTALYEATKFDVPTITMDYYFDDIVKIYGFDTWRIGKTEDVKTVFDKLKDQAQYQQYLDYLQRETTSYM